MRHLCKNAIIYNVFPTIHPDGGIQTNDSQTELVISMQGIDKIHQQKVILDSEMV